MSDFSALIVGHVRLLFRLSILCSITISVKTPTATISQAKNQEKI
jgi:hypothetical protein